jgi:hypothetical protein
MSTVALAKNCEQAIPHAAWVAAARQDKPPEFNEVDPPLAILDFCDPAMRHLQSRSELTLG